MGFQKGGHTSLPLCSIYRVPSDDLLCDPYLILFVAPLLASLVSYFLTKNSPLPLEFVSGANYKYCSIGSSPTVT
jgi:hypothetical protein